MRIGDYKVSYPADEALMPTPTVRFWVSLLVCALVLFPFFAGNYLIYLANLVGITTVSALGLNLLTGFTGQISLGHAAFMGIGAYTAAFAATKLHLPFLIAVPLGGLVSACFGVIFGGPSLRVKGLYLAMATLAAQVIAEFGFTHFESVTGGIRGINVPAPVIFGFELSTDRHMYAPIMLIAALGIWFASNVKRSRPGRAFVAVRDRDISAEMMGVDLFKTKLMAFAAGSFYAGVAGALWAYFMKVVTPEHWPLSLSINYLATVIIGGLGTVIGSVFGAIFMTLMPEALRSLASMARPYYPNAMAYLSPLTEVVFGGMIVVFLLFEPHGLAEMWQRTKRFFRLWPFIH